jgi:hypothetical protein
MSSAAEAKLGALNTTAKEMAPLHQTLIAEMGWLQQRTPIQMENSNAVGITNLTIVPQKTKSMDLCLWWSAAKNRNNSSVTTMCVNVFINILVA